MSSRLSPVPTQAKVYNHIYASPIAGALGAEISGVDISRPIDAATFAEIRRAWAENLVIFFRGQSLDDDALIAFGRHFAPLFRHPNLLTGGPYPDIVRIRRMPGDKQIVGEDWHTDTTCMEEPPCGRFRDACARPDARIRFRASPNPRAPCSCGACCGRPAAPQR